MLNAWKKSSITLLLIALIPIGLTGCGRSGGEYPELSGQEAIKAFENAANVQLTGDVDDVNTFSDVIADGQIAGKVKEHGFINSRIAYSVDNNEQFYISFCDYEEDDKVVKNPKYPYSLTYTYYDMDGKRLGYSQDRVLFKGENEWYVTVFLDTKGNMKNYYIEPYDDVRHSWAARGAGVYNMDREKVGEINMELTNIFTNSFSINMELGDAAKELSAIDRVAIYWRCVSEMNDRYGDN